MILDAFDKTKSKQSIPPRKEERERGLHPDGTRHGEDQRICPKIHESGLYDIG